MSPRDTSRQPVIKGRTAAELQDIKFEPVRWIVPDFLTEGCTILAGRPKLGKSWLALDWAVAVARGGTSLDRTCIQGDVLYAALEDNGRRLQSRLRKVTTSGQWPARLRLLLDGELPRANDGGLNWTREWLKAQEAPRLVIIDTLARVRDTKGRDEGNYEADYAAVIPWKALADEYAVAVVLVHHVRKMAAEDPLETISGTNGLTGAADAALVLNRDGQGCTLSGRGRDLEEYQHAVSFDRLSCRWTALGDAIDVRRSDERADLLAELAATSEDLTPTDLAERLCKRTPAVKMMLGRMAKAGEVARGEKRGTYRHPDRA